MTNGNVILDVPTVSIAGIYVLAGKEVNMPCKAVAHPPANFTWSFEQCNDVSKWPECGEKRPSAKVS